MNGMLSENPAPAPCLFGETGGVVNIPAPSPLYSGERVGVRGFEPPALAASQLESTNTRPAANASGSHNQTSIEHNAAILDLLTRLLSISRIEQARKTSAKLIAEHLNADFVAIGENAFQTNPCPLAVIIGKDKPKEEQSGDVEAALSECVATARKHFSEPTALAAGRVAFTTGNDGPEASAYGSHKQAISSDSTPGFAHRRLSKLLGGTQSIVSVPLLTADGRTAGALLVAWSEEKTNQDLVGFASSVSMPLAELFFTLERATPSKLKQRLDTIREQLTQRRKRTIAAIAIISVLIGLIPVRYPVRAETSIQPTIRRWIVAPFDGPLKQSHIVPGQVVKTNDLLFTIDCEETHNKLAALRAEAERAASERAAHTIAGRPSDATISGWNVKRLQSEIELLNKHLDRAEIRSPIDGVVLGEDLQRLEGSPLKLGQSLAEVAQIDQMHAAIGIPPDQIMHVTKGHQVTVNVDAAGTLEMLTLTEIYPRAEANEQGKYVFKAKAELSVSNDQLKPGMRGQATIHGEYKPLAWSLFQRLWQRLRDWS